MGIPDEWASLIGAEFDKPYMKELRAFLRQEKNQRKYIYPKGSEIFSAFELTPPEKIKCVILGQDPYHGPGQAHGLCFSVKPGVAIPPSLLNIYKELQADLQIKPVKHGCLLSWAEQGVFLLNSVLTVEKGLAASHQGQGWEIFTDKVIEQLNLQPHPIAFVLWGAYAQKKGQVIDTQKHLVLKSVHPSPLSANRGFLGSRPFSKINDFLVKTGQTPINWQLPEQAEYI
ncbi:uracil-DNA glycosylase [Candidatus Berkiella cookevillensis]|uniref:Uracil-DNA glycosylase n=1 Tax=Candidatus Berkiella cookevillensis TaxID=437022 RepID=A0AAE3HS14_9GAMM|nr:uracil-DNA glycosylase [Candidatus Berkiella cookevillensis]MCS5709512.1 uracil-DNA glycosylase [Candidatus Berkiella cookevillensis]